MYQRFLRAVKTTVTQKFCLSDYLSLSRFSLVEGTSTAPSWVPLSPLSLSTMAGLLMKKVIWSETLRVCATTISKTDTHQHWCQHRAFVDVDRPLNIHSMHHIDNADHVICSLCKQSPVGGTQTQVLTPYFTVSHRHTIVYWDSLFAGSVAPHCNISDRDKQPYCQMRARTVISSE